MAHALQALSPAPLLFLTGRAEEDDVFSGLASGAAAYLTKPFRPGTLREGPETLPHFRPTQQHGLSPSS